MHSNSFTLKLYLNLSKQTVMKKHSILCFSLTKFFFLLSSNNITYYNKDNAEQDDPFHSYDIILNYQKSKNLLTSICFVALKILKTNSGN